MKRLGEAELLRSLPAHAKALLRALLAEADARGVALHLVGGPVRDLLMQLPLRDLDLVGEASPEALAELAKAALPSGRVVAHDRFGTLRLEGEGGAALDLTSARRESYAHAGALPSVEPGSLEEDLWRRDFSVNALALPLSAPARMRGDGVIDPTGGIADLEGRSLRVLHAQSFRDDPTRALRAARLAPRLGMSPARETRAALRDALRDGAFARVSGDRYRRELEKLFEDARLGLDPARALRWLDASHVLGALEPGLALAHDAVAPLRRYGRAVGTPPWRGPGWRVLDAGLALWLAPLTPGLRERTLRRLAVRGSGAARIAGAPRLRDRCLRALARTRGRGGADALLRELREEELVALHAWADASARLRIARFAGEDRARKAPLDGGDLVALGLKGADVGSALARVRAAYLDGQVRSREEALALAAELGRPARPATRRKRQA